MFVSLVFVAFMVASCVASDEETTREPGFTYVSLGDSLAVGVGSSAPSELGYAPLYRDELAGGSGAELRFVQLGLSGETSESFIGSYPNGASQLTEAVEVLSGDPGSYVTLSLGGNDLLGAGRTNLARRAALEEYADNLDFILATLNGASEPAPRITVLAPYDPAPGGSTERWTSILGDEIRAAAGRNGANVVAGDEVFRGNEAEYTRAARYPWDIHPTDAGYAALAEAFAAAREP